MTRKLLGATLTLALVGAGAPSAAETSQSTYPYRIIFHTGTPSGAGTDANVEVTLYGESGANCAMGVVNWRLPGDAFENGQTDTLTYECPTNIGRVKSVSIYPHDDEAWYLDKVTVWADHMDPKPRGWAVTVNFDKWMPESWTGRDSDWWINEGSKLEPADLVGTPKVAAVLVPLAWASVNGDPNNTKEFGGDTMVWEYTVGGSWARGDETNLELENTLTISNDKFVKFEDSVRTLAGKTTTLDESMTQSSTSQVTVTASDQVGPKSVGFLIVRPRIRVTLATYEIQGQVYTLRKVDESTGTSRGWETCSASSKMSRQVWNEVKQALTNAGAGNSEISGYERRCREFGGFSF